ncbi:MAG: DUF3592 domain-containing protein [Candidatus Acidiferrales bacterium]
MKEFLSNWKDLLPAAGLAVLVILGIFFWMRRAPEDPGETERQRRAYLNRVGRIVEGQVLEIVDQAREPQIAGTGRGAKGGRAQKLLYYTYSISGVTYETAQDITGIEEQAHLGRVAAGQTASVKYDPSNPSNSILLADDWSGLN